MDITCEIQANIQGGYLNFLNIRPTQVCTLSHHGSHFEGSCISTWVWTFENLWLKNSSLYSFILWTTITNGISCNCYTWSLWWSCSNYNLVNFFLLVYKVLLYNQQRFGSFLTLLIKKACASFWTWNHYVEFEFWPWISQATHESPSNWILGSKHEALDFPFELQVYHRTFLVYHVALTI